jgi:uncharacterized protein with FMN-binding domain
MKNTNPFLQSITRKLSGRRISGSLITLSSAAIFAVYAAGYEQTKAAADRFEQQTAERLASYPIPVAAEEIVASPGFFLANVNSSLPTESAAVRRPTAVSVNRAVTAETDANSSLTASNAADSSNVTTAPAVLETTEIPTAKQAEVTPVLEPVAVANIPHAAEPAAPPQATRQSLYKDGTYEGWGTSRHGDIGVSVVIQDGRIASAIIAQCRTRYPCSWIAQLPGQVISRQSPNVDYVSGATQSVNAYYTAVVEALSKAK